jgi:hypothetical protein
MQDDLAFRRQHQPVVVGLHGHERRRPAAASAGARRGSCSTPMMIGRRTSPLSNSSTTLAPICERNSGTVVRAGTISCGRPATPASSGPSS